MEAWNRQIKTLQSNQGIMTSQRKKSGVRYKSRRAMDDANVR